MRVIRVLPRAIVATGAVLLFALMAGLAATPGAAQNRGAGCVDDAYQFCSAQIPDAKAVESCLKRNARRLSPACRAEFRPARKVRRRAVRPSRDPYRTMY